VLRHRVDCDDFSRIVHLPTTTPTAFEHYVRLEEPILVNNLKVWCHKEELSSTKDCQSNSVCWLLCPKEGAGCAGTHGMGTVRARTAVFSARSLDQPTVLTAEPVVTALADPKSRLDSRSGQLFCEPNWNR